MKKLQTAKEKYQSIEIPDELGNVVNNAIHTAGSYRKKQRKIWYKAAIGAVACASVMFVLGVNTSPVFAESMYNIPIIGQVAHVFTFNEYEKQDDTRLISVQMPELSNTGNTDLEKRINTEILAKIDNVVAEAEERAKEYKQAFLETGGKEEDYMKPEIHVDYAVKSSNDQAVSFVITKYEGFASAYTEQYFYNVDLKTGKNLTLLDQLGSDYKTIADQSVRTQMDERTKADPNTLYFEDDMDGFQGIADDQNFYINEYGNVVIVFQKYEIAPGYMGIQEFEIK